MFEGKKFFGVTGMPILNMARASSPLAVWLPESLTVAIEIEKSFTIAGRSSILPGAGWSDLEPGADRVAIAEVRRAFGLARPEGRRRA